MRIATVMAVIVAVLLWAMPAVAATDVLPRLGDGSYYTTFLYGGNAGQEAWWEFEEDLNEKTAGAILGAPGAIPGVEPHSIYGWYRMRGNISGELPQEAHDFTIGTVYAVDDTPDDWMPYFAAEQVRWTSGPEIDKGYYGLGAEWLANDAFTLNGAVWHDGTENYRLTGSIETTFRVSSTAELMVWCLVDDGDAWGLWRLTVIHPMGADTDAVFVYEESTRSSAVILGGIGLKF